MTNITQYPSRSLDQAKLRLPEGLRDQIKDAAKQAGRSMNAEIVQRLEASFETGGNLSKDIQRIIEQHIEDEILRRFRALSSQLGRAAS